MDPDTQNLLEGTQRDINLILRKLHDHDGSFDQVVTAIVSTTTRDSTSVASNLVLFNGFLKSKSCSLLRGDGRSGLVLSIQRIFHKKLRDTIRGEWKANFAGCGSALAKPPHVVADKTWIEAFLKDQLDAGDHRIQLPTVEGSHSSRTMVCLEGPLPFRFESIDEQKYRVTVTGCKPFDMDLTECKFANSVVSESSLDNIINAKVLVKH